MGVYEDHCYYFLPMAGWFFFSALMSSYNKLVFGEDGKISFACPLLLTSIHFFAQWIFSETLCALYPTYLGSDRVSSMSWKEWFSISVPCGMVTSGDIGLSNLSIVTISLTFYTMVKASAPIFVLFWAYLFGIERITVALVMVVVIIAAGEYLTVVGEVDFDLHGFLLCLSASILSGARWTLVQLKLHSLEPPLKTTIATMRILAPSMFASLFFVALVLEKPWASLAGTTFPETVEMCGLVLAGAFFAIAMILCEFYLIMHASAIILMIGGVIKEMITIFVGVTFFGDDLNRINLAGCFVVFLGVVLYKVTFHLEKRKRARQVESSSPLPHLHLSDVNMMGDGSNGHGHKNVQYERLLTADTDRICSDDDEDLDESMDGQQHASWTNGEGIELRKSMQSPSRKRASAGLLHTNGEHSSHQESGELS